MLTAKFNINMIKLLIMLIKKKYDVTLLISIKTKSFMATEQHIINIIKEDSILWQEAIVQIIAEIPVPDM